MQWLRTNTATRITVGPFLDKTDGVTPETGLAVANCKLTLVVDVAGIPSLVLDTAPTAMGGDNDMVHVANDDAGYYDLELTAANVNFLGRAKLAITDPTTHCPVFHEFMIVPQNVWDSMFGTEKLEVKLGNVAHGGTAATLALKRFEAINADAEAVFIQSTSAALPAVHLLGTWGGLWVEGVTAVAAAFTCSNAPGIFIEGAVSGPALLAMGHIEADLKGNITGNLAGTINGFTSAAKAEINAEMLDVLNVDTPIDGKTIIDALKIIAAVVAGKITTAQQAQEIFLGLDGATTRVTVTADSSGNRSNVAYA
jgi:hypothetical protein